ncbi:MAG: BtpA/SgcQ family protein [Phycisphaerales bacterium]|nr:BtpA/SgcQ family protein [Phycisphaerales bacterium]
MTTPQQGQNPVFGRPNALIGMVHLRALPGAPKASLAPQAIIGTAVAEARLLERAGFDAILVENMHDRPYLADASGADTVALFAIAAAAVVASVKVTVGIQILSGANCAALAVAHAAGASFIRVEGFVFASVADEGIVAKACAGDLLRERRRLGAESVKVLADVRKKHSSHALTADLDIGAWVRGAEFFGADGVIVTGAETAMEPDEAELEGARAATQLPVLAGSGATLGNLARMFRHADAVIVGSALKVGGNWANELDPARIAAMVAVRDAIAAR